MSYTLGEAARATGRNKSTILRAIKAGMMSATRAANGDWAIDAAELGRVYPLLAAATPSATPVTTQRNGSDTGSNNSEAMAQLMARLADKDAVIDDLRRRLDAAEEARLQADAERRQTAERLTALLTISEQRPRNPRPFRARRLGVGGGGGGKHECSGIPEHLTHCGRGKPPCRASLALMKQATAKHAACPTRGTR